MASPEFPETMADCIFQQGQYVTALQNWFKKLVPYRSCVEAAKRLLSGERVLKEASVVYQSGASQGSGVHSRFENSYYGTTYFCYSARPELYV